MKKISINVLYRLLEIMGGCVVMSAFICLLCVSGLMPVGSIQRDIALALLSPIYIIWNMLSLRRHYFYLHNKNKFYKVNLRANVIFALISVLAYMSGFKKPYSWLFLATALFRFSNIGITSIASILLFHTVLVISVFIAPIGMGWLEERIKEMEELEDIAPGFLEIDNYKNPKALTNDDTEVSVNENEREKDTLS